jgi:hypothetical protein
MYGCMAKVLRYKRRYIGRSPYYVRWRKRREQLLLQHVLGHICVPVLLGCDFF